MDSSQAVKGGVIGLGLNVIGSGIMRKPVKGAFAADGPVRFNAQYLGSGLGLI